MAEIKLTINGKEVTGEKGDSVLKVCERNNIYVPTLCHHKALTDTGACRLCLVEIEGQRGYRPACSTQAENGMVVRTDTETIKKLRRTVLEFLFSERNHFCMFCEASGDCELQKLAYEHGIEHAKYGYAMPIVRVDSTRRYFVFDENRCILCQRCVRACSEVAGHNVLDVGNRGAESRIIADLNVPFGESSCTSCGTCLQVCPTGALFDRHSAYLGRGYQCETMKSVCSSCSIGCGIEVVTRDNHIVKINGDWDAMVNKGVLCVAGRFEPLYIENERIMKPMIRKNGDFYEISWDEALNIVKEKFTNIGMKDVFGIISQRATNEEAKLFVELLGTEKVSVLGPWTVQNNGSKGSLSDIRNSDCILVYKIDLDNENRVAGSFVKLAVYKGNANLIVVDDNKNSLERHSVIQLTVNELDKAKDLLQRSSNPVIIYGSSTSKDEVEKLSSLDNKVKLVEMMPGANAMGLRKLGIISNDNFKNAKALYVLACDETSYDIEKNSAEFVVLQASYMNSSTSKADLLLPSPIWAERAGTLTNIDGLTQRSEKVINAPESVLSTEDVIRLIISKIAS